MYYATYDGYANPETGGGFANTKSLVAYARKADRDNKDMRYTPITRREAVRQFGGVELAAAREATINPRYDYQH